MTTLGIAGLRTQARSWNALVRQRVWRLAPGDLERVVLRHSRIFILPTRRGMALMATLATMLLTSMNYALSLGFALTFLAGGMVAAGLLATFRNLAGLAASPLGAGEARVNEARHGNFPGARRVCAGAPTCAQWSKSQGVRGCIGGEITLQLACAGRALLSVKLKSAEMNRLAFTVRAVE